MARVGKAKRVQVPLSDSRYEGLERYAEMQGGSLANEASILFSNLIDEMMADGRIPPPPEKDERSNQSDEETEDTNETLKRFIKAVRANDDAILEPGDKGILQDQLDLSLADINAMITKKRNGNGANHAPTSK